VKSWWDECEFGVKCIFFIKQNAALRVVKIKKTRRASRGKDMKSLWNVSSVRGKDLKIRRAPRGKVLKSL
jgi:hypothetical protein